MTLGSKSDTLGLGNHIESTYQSDNMTSRREQKVENLKQPFGANAKALPIEKIIDLFDHEEILCDLRSSFKL